MPGAPPTQMRGKLAGQPIGYWACPCRAAHNSIRLFAFSVVNGTRQRRLRNGSTDTIFTETVTETDTANGNVTLETRCDSGVAIQMWPWLGKVLELRSRDPEIDSHPFRHFSRCELGCSGFNYHCCERVNRSRMHAEKRKRYRSHTRTVVRECLKATKQVNGKGQNSTPRHTKTP